VADVVELNFNTSTLAVNNLGGVNCVKDASSCNQPNEIRYRDVGRLETVSGSTRLDLVVTNTTFYEHWNPAINGHAP